jgi:hypothetical protein
VEGSSIAHDFSPETFSGVNATPTAGAVIRHSFVATDTAANITLSGVTASTTFDDRNATLSAVTLEALAAAAPVPALDAKAMVMLAVLLAAVAIIALRRV